MKKMKIIITLIYSILLLGIGVGAATMFNAKDISFAPNNGNWNVDNISDAVDDLYEFVSEKGDIGSRVKNLGEGSSFDIKNLYPDVDYTKLTLDNFIYGIRKVDGVSSRTTWYSSHSEYIYQSYSEMKVAASYDNSTGILTLNCTGGYAYSGYQDAPNGYHIKTSPLLFAYLII